MCRSPLPNRIQPSAMRCLVGRRPTSRSMDLTSCHGQPVSEEREAEAPSRSAPSTEFVNTMVRDAVIGTPEPFQYQRPTIVAFVTYRSEDATPSQQDWGNSNLAAFGGNMAFFRPGPGPNETLTGWLCPPDRLC